MDCTKIQEQAEVVVIEPFYGGSHKQLVDLLTCEIDGCARFTLSAKKWHWRARTSALYFAQTIPYSKSFKVLFCSSVVNLAELIAIRTDLGQLRKVIYFHENQLVYPVRKQQERDFQYGYNQIISSLVADKVVFNSKFNMDSFLNNMNSFLKLIPDNRPKNLVEQIQPKCSFLYFPIIFSQISYTAMKQEISSVTYNQQEQHMSCRSHSAPTDRQSMAVADMLEQKQSYTEQTCTSTDHTNAKTFNSSYNDGQKVKKLCVGFVESVVDKGNDTKSEGSVPPLHIVWPHRWEHDKNPELFFRVLMELKEKGFTFNVSVLGETFTDVPDIFEKSKEELSDHIIQWGYLPTKSDYYQLLQRADVVVSTADHEFFGVAMLEAIYCGCYPLCPNRLVYPEIVGSDEYLYNTERQLFKKLKQFCSKPYVIRNKTVQIDLERFSWPTLKPYYMELLKSS